MIAQVAAAALASENKVLAHPASVDTIPTSANQEDHVSMGVTAARKLREIVDNVEHVLALEWLCAAQAREFGHSQLDEVRILMLHGVLHLMGMDHETDGGAMARAEARWRKKLKLPVGLIGRMRP